MADDELEFRPPERHRAQDALQRMSVEAAMRIGEALGDSADPVVVDTRRHVSLDALDRMIGEALEDNARWRRSLPADGEE